MPSYRYTGTEPRISAPPLQGDLIPGELVASAEPVDHPDLEPANDAAKQVAPDLTAQAEQAAPQAADDQPAGEALPVEDIPRRRRARSSEPKE